jgi:integrase/recombinase XerC
MMELMYSSGLRLSECVNLDVEDIDLEVPELKVTGKGNKTRYLPIGRAAVKVLKRWYSVRAQMVKENERAVFISQRGVRLSQRTVQSRVQLAARQCGLGMHLHPHMLRHSFASHILQSSGDLRSLQELLGHANISTTQVYTQLDFQHLAKVYDDAHPRAKKKSD